MNVLVCLMTSTYVNGMEKVVSPEDVQLCSMYFEMDKYEITTLVPKLFTAFFFENGVSFLFFFALCRVPLEGISPRGG